MPSKEEVVREQRKIEAVNKNYMGLNGKISQIAHYMGTPIIRHDAVEFDEDLGENEYQTMSEDDTTRYIGLIYDGLRDGIHMEIKLLEDYKEITLYYQGKLVYKESDGELDCYVPGNQWETLVEGLAKRAARIARAKKAEKEIETKQEKKKLAARILEKLKINWGI